MKMKMKMKMKNNLFSIAILMVIITFSAFNCERVTPGGPGDGGPGDGGPGPGDGGPGPGDGGPGSGDGGPGPGPGDGDPDPVNPGGGDRIINIAIAGNWEIESEAMGQFLQITNTHYGLSANNLNTSGVGFNQSYIDMENPKNISAYSNSDKYFVIEQGSMGFLLFAWETNTSADPDELYICQLEGEYNTSALAEAGATSISPSDLNRSAAPVGGCRSASDDTWTTYTVDDIAIAGNWEIETGMMGQFLQISNTQYGLSIAMIDTLGMAFNQSYIDMESPNNISVYSNSDKYFVIAQDPMGFRLFVWETNTSADPNELYICQLGDSYNTSALAEAGVANILPSALNRGAAPDGGCGSASDDAWTTYTVVVDPVDDIAIAGNWEIESEAMGQFLQITNTQYGLSASNLNTSGVGFNQSYIDMGNSKNISAYSNSDKYFVIANGSMDFLLFAWETNTSADPDELYICQLEGEYNTSALAEDAATSISLTSLNRSAAPDGGCRSADGVWTTYTVDDIAIAGNWEIERALGQFLQISNTQYGLSIAMIDTLGTAFNQSYIDMQIPNSISAYSNSDKYFVIANDSMDFQLFVWETDTSADPNELYICQLGGRDYEYSTLALAEAGATSIPLTVLNRSAAPGGGCRSADGTWTTYTVVVDPVDDIAIAGNWKIESETMGQFLQITNTQYGLSANSLNTSGVGFSPSYIDMENYRSISAYSNNDKYFVIANGSMDFRLFAWETNTSADPDELYICQLGGEYNTSAFAEAGVASIPPSALNRSAAPDGGCGSASDDAWTTYTFPSLEIAGRWVLKSNKYLRVEFGVLQYTPGSYLNISTDSFSRTAEPTNTSMVGFSGASYETSSIKGYNNNRDIFAIRFSSLYTPIAWVLNTSTNPDTLHIRWPIYQFGVSVFGTLAEALNISDTSVFDVNSDFFPHGYQAGVGSSLFLRDGGCNGYFLYSNFMFNKREKNWDTYERYTPPTP